jgi:heterodisulfide reductase subunit A-like polyferredoxin
MKLTPEKLTAFCAALAETANVSKACAAIGVSRYTAYNWRKHDPDFASRWDDAMKAALLGLEDEVHRRAFDGMEEPLTHQGQFSYIYERDEKGQIIFDEEMVEREVITKAGKSIEKELVRTPRYAMDANGQPRVATVRKYSDTLAIFLLKAHDPDKYRENSKVQLTGANDGPIEFDQTVRSARLAAIVAKLTQRKGEPGSDLA